MVSVHQIAAFVVDVEPLAPVRVVADVRQALAGDQQHQWLAAGAGQHGGGGVAQRSAVAHRVGGSLWTLATGAIASMSAAFSSSRGWACESLAN